MSETVGLSIQVDGDISAAKKRIDELARYADSTLSQSFSRAMDRPGATGGRFVRASQAYSTSSFSPEIPRQIESAIKRGFDAAIPSISTAISNAIRTGIGNSTVRVNVSGSTIRDTVRTEIQRNARASGVALSRESGGSRYVALQDFESSARRYGTRAPVSQYPSDDPGVLQRMMSYFGAGSSNGGMANKPSNNRSTQYGYQSGLFRDRAVGGMFTIQQAIEDYSYAGLRGAANNIAFMAAQLGGPAGLAAVAGLAAYQFYEMGKAAGWWGKEAKQAEQRTRTLTSSIQHLIETQAQANQHMAGANESAYSRFSGSFSTQGASQVLSGRFGAMQGLVRSGRGQQLVNVLARDIQRNPTGYAGIAPGVAERESAYAALQAANADEIRKTKALNTLRKFGGQFGGNAWMRGGLAKNPAYRDKVYSVASEFGDIGRRYADDLMSGRVDGNKLNQLEESVSKAAEDARLAAQKYDDSVRNLGLTASSTAKEILSMAQSNGKASDAVERAISTNQMLSFEYEKQKRLLREKAVLEDRSSFQSQGFDLMRQKGRQYMEQAGMPEWMIQRRELGLYERQGSMLYSMANNAGSTGDIQGKIKYLKELQQLQLQLAGQSDNRFVSEKAFSAAIYSQSLIEESIRKTTDGSNQEYQMIQQLASGVAGVRDLILTMPKIDLGLERQVLLAKELQDVLNLANFRSGLGLPAGPQPFGNPNVVGPGGGPKFATGGHIPGYGGGDKVPAMLEKGEFVVRKEAVRALGADYLQAHINRAHVQKFASGGYVYGYRSDHAYRGTRRMSAQGLPWYVNGRIKPRASAYARDSVNEWMASYGTPTYRERLMAQEGVGAGGTTAGFASIDSAAPVSVSLRFPASLAAEGYKQNYARPGMESSTPGLTDIRYYGGRPELDAYWRSRGRGGFGTSGTYGQTGGLSSAQEIIGRRRFNFAANAERRRQAYQAEMAQRRSLGWRGVNARRNAFTNYANGMFGGGFNDGPALPFGMSYEQAMYAQQMMQRQNMVARSVAMMGPWANRSFGLWDQGGLGLGGRFGMGALRGFAKGGFVDPYGGTLVASNPDILQEGNPWQYQGFIRWNSGWGSNDAAFQDQRNRVLAGSLNAAYGGPTDFAGNTLGSFGRFSDGSFKSRYSGGFGSGMGGGGFSSMVRNGGFTSFGRPIGAMTGGYVAGLGHIQKFATGGIVNATQARDVAKSMAGVGTGSSVHNNFGNVTIRVETPRDVLDTANSMRRAQSSFWSRRG